MITSIECAFPDCVWFIALLRVMISRVVTIDYVVMIDFDYIAKLVASYILNNSCFLNKPLIVLNFFLMN